MGEGPAATNKPWMQAVSVCLFVRLICPPAAAMPLFFNLLDRKSCKNESEKCEECECVGARFGDCGDHRNPKRVEQPRDQGGVHRGPRCGVLADRAAAR